jgi:hypothetical protein
MRYRINWTESVGYYAYVEADSPEEAIQVFLENGVDSCEPDGFCEMQDDAEATEEPE